MKVRLCLTLAVLLLGGCVTKNHIVHKAYINGEVVQIPEAQLDRYWVHDPIPPEMLDGPGPMGCIKIAYVIDSYGEITMPVVEAIYGDRRALEPWAMGVLNSFVRFSVGPDNGAHKAVVTKLTLSFNHTPDDVKDWAACQAAVATKPPVAAHS